MLFRVSWCGREIITIELVRQAPELVVKVVTDDELFQVDEDADEEPAALAWTSSDAEDMSHVIWHPVEVNPDVPQ